MYLPTAYYEKLVARHCQAAALERDLDELMHEAGRRKGQLGDLMKARRLAREAGQILDEMRRAAAIEDVNRNLPRRGAHA